MARDWDVRAGELSAESYAQGEPTRWFDRLYAAGEAGEISMPWERDEPHRLLRLWTRAQALHGEGRRAVVVGCGLSADTEHLARLGFDTIGFDVSGTAVRLARERHPDTAVDYRVADLLDLPEQWRDGFDLVVEVFTVQALPDPPRAAAIRAVSTLVAPGGTLLAIAFRRVDGDDPDAGPPFPLDRATMDSLAGDHLRIFAAEELDGPLWRVVYDR